MKLGVEHRRIDLNGLKTRSYGVGDIAVFQQVARSSMYSDPYRAAVQEYVSNAIDAMRERQRFDPTFEPSNDKIKITLTESELAIKDQGIGISPYRMENGFASYYGSSKRDSNDEIGGFGLGCKTAFADPNRDSFTVDTVYEEGGTRWRYITYHFIDQSGLTSYAEISHTPTTEDLGTTIVLPIDEADLELYQKVLASLCMHWDVKPQVLGLPFEWPKVEYVFEGPDGLWKVVHGKSAMEVVVEGIPYAVSKSQLPKDIQAHADSGVVLFFRTGEVAVTSTRESLDYRGDTVAKIAERLQDIRESLAGRISSLLDSGISLWNIQGTMRAVKSFLQGSTENVAISGGAISIPPAFKPRKYYDSLQSQSTGYFQFANKFSVLLSKSQKVNLGRLQSFFDSEDIDEVIVLTVPQAWRKVSITGPDALQTFINLLEKHNPEFFIRDILHPKYDLSTWPVHADYRRKKVKRKVVNDCLVVGPSGKWVKAPVETLDTLNKSRCLYIRSSNLKSWLGKNDNPPTCSVASERVIVVDEKATIPDHWLPYRETVTERLGNQLKKAKKVASELRKKSVQELAQHVRISGSETKLWWLFPKNVRKFLRQVREDGGVFISLTDQYPVFRCVIDSPFTRNLSCKVLKSYKGEGGVRDQQCAKAFFLSVRKAVLKSADRKVQTVQASIKKVLAFGNT